MKMKWRLASAIERNAVMMETSRDLIVSLGIPKLPFAKNVQNGETILQITHRKD